LGGAASGKAGVRRRRASRRPDLGDDASSLGRVNCKLVMSSTLSRVKEALAYRVRLLMAADLQH
jgi:hypothetical protein